MSYKVVDGTLCVDDLFKFAEVCRKNYLNYIKSFNNVYEVYSRYEPQVDVIEQLKTCCHDIRLTCMDYYGQYYQVQDTSVERAYTVLWTDVEDYLMNCGELTLENIHEAIKGSDLS